MAWQTPKTDWSGNDYFNAIDWLRITGNVEYIANALSIAFTPLTNVTDGQTLLTASDRNNITDTLDVIYNELSASWARGYVAPRVEYGATWSATDLNNIEEFLLNAKKQLDGEISNQVVYYAGNEIICGDTISVGLL